MSALSTFEVRVVRKTIEAADICSFELAEVNSKPLPAFSAGAHIDVSMPNGITRPYSLCNADAETHRYVIGVLKDPASRGGSRAMHEIVSEGSVLQISAPKNNFPLARDAKLSVLLAGGIGITPILSMAERLANVGEDFQMHYCARSRARAAFVNRIGESSFSSRVQFHFDDGPAEQKLDLKALTACPKEGVHLYVCGPKGFMDAVLGAARNAGWPEAQLHYEFFSADVCASEGDSSFEVQLASSGRIVVVPSDRTVVQVLSDIDVIVPTSCEQGVCGTCLTRVIEGVPDHRDLYLSADEQQANDQFLPCCSRAKSARLVLDL